MKGRPLQITHTYTRMYVCVCRVSVQRTENSHVRKPVIYIKTSHNNR